MASLVFGVIGAVIGAYVGGPAGAVQGFAIGSALGGALFPGSLPSQTGPRLADLKVQSSTYGVMIPILYASMRASGNVIWSTDLVEHQNNTTQGGKGGPSQTTTTYTYTVSLAVSLCEGPIAGVRRIWADNTLIFDETPGNTGATSSYTLNPKVYLGDETQLPDPLMESFLGVGNVPAYRGQAYIVFQDFLLTNYGNRVPNFSFEILTAAKTIPPACVTIGGASQFAIDPNTGYLWTADNKGNVPSGITTHKHLNIYDPINQTLVQQIDLIAPAGAYHAGIQGTPLHIIYNGFYSSMFIATEVGVWRISTINQTFTDFFDAPKLLNNSVPSFIQLHMGQLSTALYMYSGKGVVIWDLTNITQTQPSPYTGAGDITIGEQPTQQAYLSNVMLGTISDKQFSRYELIVDQVNNIYFRDAITNVPGTFLFQFPQNGSVTIAGGVSVSWDEDSSLFWIVGPDYTNLSLIKWFLYQVDRAGNVVGPYILDNCLWSNTANVTCHVAYNTDTSSVWLLSHTTVLNQQRLVELNVNRNTLPITTLAPTSRDFSSFTFTNNSNPAGYGTAFGDATTPAVIETMRWHSPSGQFIVYGTNLIFMKVTIRLISSAIPLADIITDLSLRTNSLLTSDIDVTQLNQTVLGYGISRATDVRSAISALQQAYFFDAVESDNVIKFVPRGSAPAVNIPTSDLAAHADGDSLPDILSISRQQELDLPQNISVVYFNPASDYQYGTQQSRRLIATTGPALSWEMPIVLTDTQARQIADASMYALWTARTTYKFQTTNKYMRYEPTDVVTIEGYTLRITTKNEDGGVYKWEAVAEQSAVYAQASVGVPPPPTGQTITPISSTNLRLLDIPMLRDEDNDAGFYYASCGNPNQKWPGDVVFKSLDEGASYADIANSQFASGLGLCGNTLGNFSGGNIFDELNSLTVLMFHGEPASSSELGVLNGINMAIVGSEMIQFKNAVLTAPNTYVLTGLLRGIKGTEWAIGTHIASEAFTLVDTTFARTPPVAGEIGLERYYKGVTVGLTLAVAATVKFTNNAVALKPYAPVLLGGGTDGSNDWIITWTRRTRFGGNWANGSDVPLNEAVESYDIEIWNSTFTLLQRTFFAVGSPTVTYTSAQQVADFGSNQSTIYVRVYQNSATIGRGTVLQGSIP